MFLEYENIWFSDGTDEDKFIKWLSCIVGVRYQRMIERYVPAGLGDIQHKSACVIYRFTYSASTLIQSYMRLE